MQRLLISCLSVLVLASCKKEITELPPATQSGAHTFGAKVDGEFWVPQGFGPVPANDILEGNMNGDDIMIRASNFSSSPTETEFVIRLKDISAPGTYQFNTNVSHPSNVASYVYFVKRRLTPENEWITSATSTGSVNITRVDPVNLIVSGTFQCTLTGTNNETLTVTDGRFDVQLQ
jgi:hypothetical protein